MKSYEFIISVACTVMMLFAAGESFAGKNSGKDRWKISFESVKDDRSGKLLKKFVLEYTGKPTGVLAVVASHFANGSIQHASFGFETDSAGKKLGEFVDESAERNVVSIYRCSDVNTVSENCGSGSLLDLLKRLEKITPVVKGELGINDKIPTEKAEKKTAQELGKDKKQNPCEPFTANLRSCTPYSCEFKDKDAKGTKLTIAGKDGDKCHFKYTKPNFECRISLEHAGRWADMMDAENGRKEIHAEYGADGIAMLTIDGKEFGKDPYGEAWAKGYCVNSQ